MFIGEAERVLQGNSWARIQRSQFLGDFHSGSEGEAFNPFGQYIKAADRRHGPQFSPCFWVKTVNQKLIWADFSVFIPYSVFNSQKGERNTYLIKPAKQQWSYLLSYTLVLQKYAMKSWWSYF